MATTEQLVKAQAAYRGEDPDAAWSAFSGGMQGAAHVPAPMPAAQPAPAPAIDTSSLDDGRLAAYASRLASEWRPPSVDNNYGAVEPGNIDLANRPWVKHPGGGISTVRSMGVGIDGEPGWGDKVAEVLVPTVSDDGRLLTADEAFDQYLETGKHLGKYRTPGASTAAGHQIHLDQVKNPPRNTLTASGLGPDEDAMLTHVSQLADARSMYAETTTQQQRRADIASTSMEVAPGVFMTRPENQIRGGVRVSDGQPVAPRAAAPAPAEDAPVAIAPPTPIGPNATGRDIVRAGMTDADAATERAQRVAADSIERRDAALDELSGINAERRKQLDEQFAADEQENAAFRERNKATMEKVDAMMDEASKTEIKDRRTRGQMIGAIIASALAGIGDAITSMAGNKTNFQENVNKSIRGLVDRDLAMQREALQDKRNSAAQKLTELGIAQKTFKDERDATEAARIARTEQYLNSAKEVAMKIGNEDQRKQALMDIEELGYRNAKAKEELGLRLAQEDRLGRKGGGGGGGAGGKKPMTVAEQIALERLQMDREKWEAEKNKGGAGAGNTAEDIPGYKRTKEVSPAIVTEATKASAAVTGLNNGLDQLSALRDEYSKTSVLDTGKRTELANRARQIIGNYADTASQLAGGGQAGEAAKQQAMEDIPDPTQWDLPGRVDPKAIYQGLKVQNRQTADAKLRSMGYEPMEAPAATAPTDDGTKVRVRTNGIETTIPRANLATAQKLGAEVVGGAEQAQATVRVRSLKTGQMGNMPAAQAAAAAKAGRVEIVQ